MSSRIPVFWNGTLHHCAFCPDLLCLSVLHFSCLFSYNAVRSRASSACCTIFGILPEIIISLPFLRIVYVACVAVHIFLCYWGQDFSVSVLNRPQNLQSGFDSRQRHKFFSHPQGLMLTHPSTQLATKALSPGANGRNVKLATRLHPVPILTTLYI
jgi:hypothetical protein